MGIATLDIAAALPSTPTELGAQIATALSIATSALNVLSLTGRAQTAYQAPSYQPNGIKDGFAGILNAGLGGVRQFKAGIFRGGGHVLRYKGDTFYRGADALDGVANRLDPNGQASTRL